LNPWFWAWVVLAIAFALGEAVTGGLYVLPWAFGAATAAVLDALRFPIEWQWISFVGVSVGLAVLAQRLIIARRR